MKAPWTPDVVAFHAAREQAMNVVRSLIDRRKRRARRHRQEWTTRDAEVEALYAALDAIREMRREPTWPGVISENNRLRAANERLKAEVERQKAHSDEGWRHATAARHAAATNAAMAATWRERATGEHQEMAGVVIVPQDYRTTIEMGRLSPSVPAVEDIDDDA